MQYTVHFMRSIPRSKRILTMYCGGILACLICSISFFACLQNEIHLNRYHHFACHTHQDEMDPCHRSIYHKDRVQGCHHQEHFQSISCTCELTQACFHQEHIPPTILHLLGIASHLKKTEWPLLGTPAIWISNLNSGRSPPDMI